MLYAFDGTQIGRKLVEDPNALAQYQRYQELAVQHSVPFTEYWPSVGCAATKPVPTLSNLLNC
jgi:hypothetical protein